MEWVKVDNDFVPHDYEGLCVSLSTAQSQKLRGHHDLTRLKAVRLRGKWPARLIRVCTRVELDNLCMPVPQTPYAWFHNITHLTLAGTETMPHSLVTPRQLEHLVIEHLYTRANEDGDHRLVSIESTSPSLSILIQNSDLYGLNLQIGSEACAEHRPKDVTMINVCLPQQWLIEAYTVVIDTFNPCYSTLNLYDLWASDLISLSRMHSANGLELHFDEPRGCVSIAPCKQLQVNSLGITLRYDIFDQFPVGTVMLNGVLAAPAPKEIVEDSENNDEE